MFSFLGGRKKKGATVDLGLSIFNCLGHNLEGVDTYEFPTHRRHYTAITEVFPGLDLQLGLTQEKTVCRAVVAAGVQCLQLQNPQNN